MTADGELVARFNERARQQQADLNDAFAQLTRANRLTSAVLYAKASDQALAALVRENPTIALDLAEREVALLVSAAVYCLRAEGKPDVARAVEILLQLLERL